MTRRTGLFSVLLALLSGVLCAPAFAAPNVSGPVPPRPTGTAAKLDGNLRNLVAVQARHGNVRSAAKNADLRVSGATVGVDVQVRGHAAQAVPSLKSLGMKVTGTTDLGPIPTVEGKLPIASLHAVAALGVVRDVLPITGVAVDRSGVGTDISSTQGVAAHNVGQAQAACHCNGAGVPVGVISDSFAAVNGGADAAASQAAGNLPPNVNILEDNPGGEDEGRAMGELIYDEVPGMTNMFFNTGDGGVVDLANGIGNLANQGVKVIADDIVYFTEPFFQDGAIAQAVNNAAGRGVAFYASAGNRARQSYAAQFTPDGGGYHLFDGGTHNEQIVTTVPNGASLTVFQQWAEPWGGATDNFTVSLYNATVDPTTPVASGSNAAGVPAASATWTNSTGSDAEVGLSIHRDSGTGTPLLKYIANGNFGPFSISTSDPQGVGPINPDASSSRGAISVAAVDQANASHNTPEDFSSRGPTVHYFDAAGHPTGPDVRQKPEVAGADGINTDLTPGGGLNPFFGTSAATPSIAGIAALALSADPSLNVGQVRAITTNPGNAIACAPDPAPADDNCGAGFLLADRAVSQALSLKPHPKKRCVVPKLKGKTLKKAKKALKKAHCKLGKVHGRRKGHVRRQKPKHGKKFPAGHKVTIWLR